MSQSLTIHYTNPAHVQSQKILRYLSLNFGPIKTYKADSNFGNVTFSSPESVRKALGAGLIDIEGRKVSLESWKPKTLRNPKSSSSSWNQTNRYEDDDDVVEVTPNRKADDISPTMQNFGGRSQPSGSGATKQGTVTRTMYAVYADNLPNSAPDVSIKNYFLRCGAERVDPVEISSDGSKMVKVFFGVEEDAQRLLDARVMNYYGQQICVRSHPKPRSPPPATSNTSSFAPPSPRGSNPYGSASRDAVVQGRGGNIVLGDDAFKAMESLVSNLSKPLPGVRGRDEDAGNGGRGSWDRERDEYRERARRRSRERASAESEERIKTLKEQLRQQKEIVEHQLTFQKEQKSFLEDLKIKLDKADAERAQLRKEIDVTKEDKLKVTRSLDQAEVEKAKLKQELSQAKAEIEKLTKENKKLTTELQASASEVQRMTKLWNDVKKENEEHKVGLLNFRKELESYAESQSRSNRIDRGRSPPGHRRRNGPPQRMMDDPRGGPPIEDEGELLRTIEELSHLRDALMESETGGRVDIDEPRFPPPYGGRNFSPPRQRRGMSPPRRDFPRHGMEGDGGRGPRGSPPLFDRRERNEFGRGFKRSPPSRRGRPPPTKYRRN